MPAMSSFEAAWCRSAPWRWFARRLVLPWALQGVEPTGDVLEIGAGSGAMAAELLATNPSVTVTVTDFDQEMVEAAAARLAPFGSRVTCKQADATALPFADGTFDVVLSWIMLHHTLGAATALSEAVRVLRPGGQVIGYDLLSTAPGRLLHRAEGAGFEMMRFGELREHVRSLPLDQAVLTPSVGGVVARFLLRKAA